MLNRFQQALIAVLAMPLPAMAHEGHSDTVIHAVLHLIEDSGVFLLLLFIAVLAALVLRHHGQASKARGSRHDSR